jgi:hypothetical protein
MLDYIQILSDKTIFARRLVAYLPKEGYIIFEGYCYVKEEDLPYKINIIRNHKELNSVYIDAEILEIYKKDLQNISEEHNCSDDECDCNISFFSLNIIILKFNILNNPIDKEFPLIDWSYCIDNRFTTMDELITRYLNLLDIPDRPFEPYDSRKEDKEFYIGFHKIMDKEHDIFSSQYDELLKSLYFKGLVNGARKAPRVASNSVIPILEKWHQLYKTMDKNISTEYGNKQFLQDCMTFFNYAEEHTPFLLQLCAEYVCDLPFYDKLRGWLTYGIKNTTVNNTPKEFEKHWKLFFRRKDEEADIVLLDSIEFDVSYTHYIKLCKEMEKEKEFKYCNVPEIIDSHKDIKCNGGLVCLHCEEQYDEWSTIVTKKYRSMNNIFINRKLGLLFIEKWLDAVIKLKDTELERIQFVWPPPREYRIRKLLSSFSKSENVYTFDEYISEFIKERDRRYHGYFVRPKVEFEFIRDLRFALFDYSIEDIYPFKESANQFNEIYLLLSHILSYISYALYIDKKRCLELVDIFDRLPGD